MRANCSVHKLSLYMHNGGPKQVMCAAHSQAINYYSQDKTPRHPQTPTCSDSLSPRLFSHDSRLCQTIVKANHRNACWDISTLLSYSILFFQCSGSNSGSTICLQNRYSASSTSQFFCELIIKGCNMLRK